MAAASLFRSGIRASHSPSEDPQRQHCPTLLVLSCTSVVTVVIRLLWEIVSRPDLVAESLLFQDLGFAVWLQPGFVSFIHNVTCHDPHGCTADGLPANPSPRRRQESCFFSRPLPPPRRVARGLGDSRHTSCLRLCCDRQWLAATHMCTCLVAVVAFPKCCFDLVLRLQLHERHLATAPVDSLAIL